MNLHEYLDMGMRGDGGPNGSSSVDSPFPTPLSTGGPCLERGTACLHRIAMGQLGQLMLERDFLHVISLGADDVPAFARAPAW